MPFRPPFDAAQEREALIAARLQLLSEIRDLDHILDGRARVGDECPGCSAVEHWRRRAEAQGALATQHANNARRVIERVRELEGMRA